MLSSTSIISRLSADEDLIEGFFRRDESALAVVHDRYGTLLKRLASRFLQDDRDRDEAVSDALMRLWEAIPPHRPVSLPAFLTTLGRRAAIDKQRSVNRRGAIPTECQSSLAELAELIPDSSGTEDQVLARELGSLLNEFLEVLPPRRREIFLRRYYGAESQEHMAEALGVSLSTVEKELKALRLSLKEKLEKEGYAG